MKTFLTRSKSSLFILALISAPVMAKPVAQVTEINGSVFVITPDGKTKSLKQGDHLEAKSEVMVDESASISFNDYYDATYHLAPGSHAKLYDKAMQLKRGKSWVQSHSARHPLALTTANGHVDFWKCEFITTFDQATSRSQVLVVNGEVEVSNILDRNVKYSVGAGSFSVVDPEIENGTPRAPTKVGLTSLNNAIKDFKQVPAKANSAAPARTIASVDTQPGQIIFIKSNRMPASVKGSAHAYYSQKIPTKKKKKTAAPIRIFGVKRAAPSYYVPRLPASVAPVAVPQKSTPHWKIDQEFEDSLKKKVDAQPKHSKELDSLIEDLKSY